MLRSRPLHDKVLRRLPWTNTRMRHGTQLSTGGPSMTSQAQAPASVPAFQPLLATPEPDDLSSHLHRLFIGILGLLLPILLWTIAGWRPTTGLQPWEILNSVSAYYYTGAAAAFVGILVALAVFLFTYRGYGNEYRRRDQFAAIIAGTAAIGVAFFPTGAPADLPLPSWWTPQTRTIHYFSAVVLFGAFIFFSLFLFPKSKLTEGESLPLGKRVRNRIYRFCGLAMLVCILWAGSALFTGAAIFWPEAVALELFAVSWLVKGHADWTAVNFGRRVLYYGRHPSQLVGEVRRAIRG